MSGKNTVKFTLDVKNPPLLKTKQRKRLAAVAAMPDEKIDYSDIQRSAATTQWTRPDLLASIENKRQITLRLDADILNFFKDTGKRYQSRINAALREYINTHQKNSLRHSLSSPETSK